MRPALADLCPSVRYREIVTTTVAGWSAHNPSITQDPYGMYWCNVRSSNYVFRNGQFIVTHPDGIIRTRNYLCQLNDDLGVVAMDWVDDTHVTPEVQYTLVRNLEDGRLFHHDGSFWMLGNSREHRSDGIPKIALDRLFGPMAVDRRIFDGPDQFRCEKNWVPILDGSGKFMYEPLPVTTYDPKTDHYSTPIQGSRADAMRSFDIRGGSQIISIPGLPECLIGVTHEVTWEPDRHYWHRFVLYSASTHAALGWTEPFSFLEPGTQFAAGIATKDDNFVVSFGHHESRALFAVVPINKVLDSII